MFTISNEKFDKFVSDALNNLDEKYKNKLHNLAIFIEDYPSMEQLKKMNLKKIDLLFGLFEGYAQAKRLNFGPVLPDRVTIFRRAIIKSCSGEKEIRQKITSTLKHEIAHHFGSDEKGARKASVN